jgi:creatinine amidohydrolase/Fe(II)-dependent formamide hydrolase-like protein
MKYLKKWSLLESVDTDDVRDLCDAVFANLYDQGFKVLPIIGNHFANGLIVRLVKNTEPFTWSEVKDYYITFLQLISKRYDLVSFTHQDKDNVRIGYVSNLYYSSDDLISELDEPDNSKILSIAIIVADKK